MKRILICLAAGAVLAGSCVAAPPSPLWKEGISLIPYPREAVLSGEGFVFPAETAIVLDARASEADRFAAADLAARLKNDFGVAARVGAASGPSIQLTRISGASPLGEQGYELAVSRDRIDLRAQGEPGLFYATRTLLQIVHRDRAGASVKGMTIRDWPDIAERAIHYDTKHHQDKSEYVREFIRTLADYKINMLVWEWEDKFAYPSHPEIGAPGAFTLEEMQAFTHYARQYHVQIVPLVQGLGHVSFILKWPQYAHLREIPASNWEFCPRKEGTYQLLFDLWADAMKATPGSSYIHLGTDETYELGQGIDCGCRGRAAEVGRYGLMMDFLERCHRNVAPQGRKVMAWVEEYKPEEKAKAPKGLVTFPEPLKLDLARQSRDAGNPAWIYDPNPGIEHLFLPYLYRRSESGGDRENSLDTSYRTLATAAPSKIFDGMLCTSWDDSGLHNQVWMMRFVHAAEYSWNGRAPTHAEFVDKYVANFYGPEARDLPGLWMLLNRGAYFYMDSFGRKVWHEADAEKTALPDLPVGEIVEFKPFWNRQYKQRVEAASSQSQRMQRALEICEDNLRRPVRHAYDFEVFASIARMIGHSARTYRMLSELEAAIGDAQDQHFVDRAAAQAALDRAAGLIEANLKERANVFNCVIAVWEKTRLPKGLSTPDKQFFWSQDRARHFAFRKPDMSYLICDEQSLALEEYLGKLRAYSAWYAKQR